MKKVLLAIVPLLMIPVFGLAQGCQSLIVLFGGFVLTFVIMLDQQQSMGKFLYDAMHFAIDKFVPDATLVEISGCLCVLVKSAFGAAITLLLHSYFVTEDAGVFFLVPLGYFCLLVTLGLSSALIKRYITGLKKIVAVIIVALQCLWIVWLTYDALSTSL